MSYNDLILCNRNIFKNVNVAKNKELRCFTPYMGIPNILLTQNIDKISSAIPRLSINLVYAKFK